MNDLTRAELATSLPEFGTSFAQITSDMTGRFAGQSQALASMIAEWNGEICQFVSQRLQRNGDAVEGMTKCQSLPEMFAIQGQWLQHAADDYLKEASKLMEVNSRCMRLMFEPTGHQTHGPAGPLQPPTGAPKRGREHRESGVGS